VCLIFFKVVGGGSNKMNTARHKITSSLAILGVKELEGYDEQEIC
jgi:hypothetical protein